MLNLILSAIEPSGDHLAAALLTALRARGPVRARGIAGPAMRAAGVEPIDRMEAVSAMGITAVLQNLGRIRAAAARLRNTFQQGADALVVIDGPDFHLPLAKTAREQKIFTVGYVSPQVWAWRRRRVHTIAARLDALLCLFSFEPALYPEGFPARWVGHPVRDRISLRQASPDPNLYGLLPASRRQELDLLLPDFLHAAEQVRRHRPSARFVLPIREELAAQLPALPPYITRVGPGVGALRRARGALTKSGTVTLELATMGVPQVVAHRVRPLTYALGRWLVTGVQHVALPNILAQRAVVPEYLQRFTPAQLADALLSLPQAQPVDLAPLGPGGAADRAADTLLELLA